MIDTIIRKRIQIKGVVQGVGFRPFVWQCANKWGLTGWVNNDSTGVTVEIQGRISQTHGFLNDLQHETPPQARVDSISMTAIDVIKEAAFAIVASSVATNQSTPISPEITICDACLAEMLDRRNRRYLYPFINCTDCGPRFTIVEDIPYDRPSTTMKSFAMCRVCQEEYDDPHNRRFHAQPNACHDCGPKVWLVDQSHETEPFDSPPNSGPVGRAAIAGFRSAIEQGKIVGVKGIGGFHLACDASNRRAVQNLRDRKGRVDKPFAVMVRDLEQAKRFARVSEPESRLLTSQERPIVLLAKKTVQNSGNRIPSFAVAPGNDLIGVMLPYSPLHYLLCETSPLVMTSGNLSDESIVRTNQEAKVRLARLADCFLLHDREIQVVCDDSVVRSIGGPQSYGHQSSAKQPPQQPMPEQTLLIRRSRGYAPLPLNLKSPGPNVLAIGAEIKSTFCVTKNNNAYLSQHVGEMGNLETIQVMERCVEHYLRLFRVQPELVAADLHPGYLSGQWAEGFANQIGVPLVRVQHHFAHVASLIAESNLPLNEQIIGCCFDGTGYGTDRAIWGGEFMIANGFHFDRVARLKYMPLPGGDASVQRPYRVALAQLWNTGNEWCASLPCVADCPPAERKLLRQQLEKNLNCVMTSSMGRLFDAVASLIGVRHHSNYEAQAAMELEALAARRIDQVIPAAYAFQIKRGPICEIDCAEMLGKICADLGSGVDRATIAAQFHDAVARMVVDVCVQLREDTSINRVGLTGGVFQNVLLSRLARRRLMASNFEVLVHSFVPPNDGGIALGQAIVGQAIVAQNGVMLRTPGSR